MADRQAWCGIGAPTDADGDSPRVRRTDAEAVRGHIPNSRAPLPGGDSVTRTRVALV